MFGGFEALSLDSQSLKQSVAGPGPTVRVQIAANFWISGPGRSRTVFLPVRSGPVPVVSDSGSCRFRVYRVLGWVRSGPVRVLAANVRTRDARVLARARTRSVRVLALPRTRLAGYWDFASVFTTRFARVLVRARTRLSRVLALPRTRLAGSWDFASSP